MEIGWEYRVTGLEQHNTIQDQQLIVQSLLADVFNDVQAKTA
ncbi:hypothetical protein [Vibrio sp. STUT-A11]|nr:hypothetical protein [Vibrio sp. STUT-A11]